MQKGQSQNCSVPKQQPRSRGWGALALVMVLAATGFTAHRHGCRVQSWKWHQLGEEVPLLWVPIPLFGGSSLPDANCTIQARP